MARESDLLDFHTAFEMPMHSWRSGVGCKRTLLLWGSLIDEEHQETIEAIIDMVARIERGETPTREQAEHLLKEIADLRYVAGGLAVALGMELEAADAAVHESNMSKLGDDGKPVRRDDGKVLKGPNYRAPNLHNMV
jgi:predicted HAD superfamily Cof-like phosphohydrolase